MKLTFPHRFTPRPYQVPIFQALDGGVRRAVLVWHRRAGKDKTLINLTIKKMVERVGVYYYFFPTYAQGRKILWDGIDKEGLPFRAHFPKEYISAQNDQEMKVRLKNGSLFQVIGTDHVDSVVGTNPVGCVFSEYALQDPSAWDFIRPILGENDGWAVFNFTPRGKVNHGYEIYDMARNNPSWYTEMLTVNDSHLEDGRRVITEEKIEEERQSGMSEDMIQQEFYCSFIASVRGAYYTEEIRQMEREGRLTRVPYEKALTVDTWWDLGIGGSTAIWFSQAVGNREIRLVDYYEADGLSITDYAKVLQEKPYVYGEHHFPHDIQVREMSGRSRKEQFELLGIKVQVVPKLSIEDGIQAGRMVFPRCWFDEKKCRLGMDALTHYHREYDPSRRDYRIHPYRDWSTHGADAFRYLAVGFKPPAPRFKTKRWRPADRIVGY